VPVISSSCPNPVTIDPDIIRTGRYGTGINNFSRLGFYIPFRCAAGDAQKAAGYGYG
jgi:hypothetical protein